MQHVVATAEGAGALDGEHVERLLDDADTGGVAAGVVAEAAGVALGQVLADGAEVDALLDVEQGLGEVVGLGLGGAQDVVGEALGRLGADAGQAMEGRR